MCIDCVFVLRYPTLPGPLEPDMFSAAYYAAELGQPAFIHDVLLDKSSIYVHIIFNYIFLPPQFFFHAFLSNSTSFVVSSQKGDVGDWEQDAPQHYQVHACSPLIFLFSIINMFECIIM